MEPGRVYTLARKVRARRRGARGTGTIGPGQFFLMAVDGRTLQIREEEPSDMPCSEEDERAPRRDLPTYLVDADDLYGANLHLPMRVAYPKGCRSAGPTELLNDVAGDMFLAASPYSMKAALRLRAASTIRMNRSSSCSARRNGSWRPMKSCG